MQLVSAYNFIDSIVVFLLLFFALFIWQLRSGNRLSHRLLSLFLVALALSYMDGVFISLGYYFHYTYAHIIFLTVPFEYTLGPLLYLYILSRTYVGFTLRKRHIYHFTVFILNFSYICVRYQLKSLEEKRFIIKTGGHVFERAEVYALTSLSTIYFVIYMLLILYTLWRYQQRIKTYFSNLHRQNLQWLFLVCCGLLGGGLMRFTNNLLWLEVPDAHLLEYFDFKFLAVTSVLIFACAVFYKCLQQPEILRMPRDFQDLPLLEKENRFSLDVDKSEKDKYRNSTLMPSLRQNYAEKLNQLMQTDKPYLNPDLDLLDLSDRLGISTHQLSEVINVECRGNFYDFVNKYRIEESLSQLQDPTNTKYITQIMYDCGFNSKSVFNTQFKQRTNMTPSQYRKTHISNTQRISA